MADLTDVIQWEDGIYRLETTDRVIGGDGGVANRQAQELANRTKYLKDRVDNIRTVSMIKPGEQQLPVNVTTKITGFTNIQWQSSGDLWSIVNQRLAPPAGLLGYWQISSSITFQVDHPDQSNALLALIIYKNGNPFKRSATMDTGNDQSGFTLSVSGIVHLTESDYVEIFAHCNAAGITGNATAGQTGLPEGNFFEALRIG